MREPILLLSMGIDSVAAWLLLGLPRAVYFNLNSRYSGAERLALGRLQADLARGGTDIYQNDDLGWMGRSEARDANVPLRNLVMATIAAAKYDAAAIYLGAAAEWARDKRLTATVLGSAALTAAGAGPRIRIVRPFRNWTKAQLIAETTKAFGRHWLQYVYSCYHGTMPPCGNCHACRRAVIAFAAARITPPYRLWDAPDWRSFPDVLRYARHGVTRRPALGEVWTTPLRLLELWQAWRNTR